MSKSQWQEAGKKLGQGQASLPWHIGAWWVYGENSYGKRATALAASPCHLNIKTCMNIGSVIRKFETSRRRRFSRSNTTTKFAVSIRPKQTRCSTGQRNRPDKPRSTRELRDEVRRFKQRRHAAPFTPVYGDVRLEQGDQQRIANTARRQR